MSSRRSVPIAVVASVSAILAALVGPVPVVAAPPPVAVAAPRVAYAFTMVAPTSVSPSQMVARVIIESPGAACPPVIASTTRGTALRIGMRVVPVPVGSLGFEGITVCRVALPPGLARASVGGLRLPLLPTGTPQRIAVFGDSGCRIATYPPTPPATLTTYQVQDCNDPAAFPLARTAGEIAAAKPDVILDTGDYFYRESDCPSVEPYAAMCAGSPPVNPPGSPNEDTYAGWKADWFGPAKALFQAAPLVLARGNHERCDRAGTGYFFLVDPGVSPADTCQRAYPAIVDPLHPAPTLMQPAWVARLGTIDLVMLDTSNSNDTVVTNADSFAYQGRRAVALLRRSGATGWLVTHAPVYAWERFGGQSKLPTWTSLTLQAVLDPVIRPFAAIWSGHLHLFQTVTIPGRPAQLTLGDGGTLLDKADQGGTLPTYGPLTDPVTGGPLLGKDGTPVAPNVPPVPAPTAGVTTFTFGWALFRPTTAPGVFTGVRFETGKGPWATCRLAPGSIACTPVTPAP